MFPASFTTNFVKPHSNIIVMAEKKPSRIAGLIRKTIRFAKYCISGVWSDPRKTLKVRIIKTLNLSVNSFLDTGLQIKSMALTYSTVLAIVPAIALLVAIGRGFGLQDSLQQQLYNFFPSQHTAISTALTFVDSYLTEATQGIFVGVGIIFLLWTLISLLSSIEDAFNSIWDVVKGRSFVQKVTDYIAICLLIPVLMICSSGISIFMSTTIQDNLYLPFLTPVINVILEMTPLVLSWLAFTLSFFLIPNIKVNFKYAAIAGAFSAIGFQILQLLFVNGQIYVSKYNAIYGSFAFLPLLLIWLQLSWMVLLAGCVLTYSLQNVFTFNFMGDMADLSDNSRHNIALILMAVIAKRFENNRPPLTRSELAMKYNLPVRIIGKILDRFYIAKLIYYVQLPEGRTGISPAVEIKDLTVGKFLTIVNMAGSTQPVPDFGIIYKDLLDILDPLREKALSLYDDLLITDLPIPTPSQISALLIDDFSETLDIVNDPDTKP